MASRGLPHAMRLDDALPAQDGASVIRAAEFWGALFWLGLGAFIAHKGHDLGLGRLNEPGSGFALFWLGLLMMGLAIPGLLTGLAGNGPRIAALWAAARWGKVLFVLALLLVYAFAFEAGGFLLCTTLLLLALMLLVDRVDIRIALPVAILIPAGVWWVITKLLKIQLPAGVMAPWLP